MSNRLACCCVLAAMAVLPVAAATAQEAAPAPTTVVLDTGLTIEFTGLPPASHAAGFRLQWLKDPTRGSLVGDRPGRELQLSLWYPAKDSGAALTLGGYADRFAATPAPLPGWPDARAQLAIGQEGGLPERGIDALRAQPTRGRLEAEPAAGRFPLVVLAQGLFYESPVHQAYLAEALAERGYVVASAPLLGARSLFARIAPEVVEAQARDLEVVLAHARALPNVDPAKVAFVGFDLGGLSALKAWSRACCAAAYVSLDSGVAAPALTEPTIGRDLSGARGAWLVVTRPREELEARGLPEDFALLDGARGARRHVLRVPGMRHADFSNLGLTERAAPGLWGPPPAAPGEGWTRTVGAVLAFLGQELRGEVVTDAPWEAAPAPAPVTRLDTLVRDWLANPTRAPAIPPARPCAWEFASAPGAADVARLEEELRFRRGSEVQADALAALKACVAPAPAPAP